MALNIKNREAHRLARELADKTGNSITEAVTDALRDAHGRALKQKEISLHTLATELDQIALHCAALPLNDKRSPDEILGYDEMDLPRL
jgi:antitoxin VapB